MLIQMHAAESQELLSAHRLELGKTQAMVTAAEQESQKAYTEVTLARELRADEISSLQETLKLATESFAATIRPLDAEIASLKQQLLANEENHAESTKTTIEECESKVNVAVSKAEVYVCL